VGSFLLSWISDVVSRAVLLEGGLMMSVFEIEMVGGEGGALGGEILMVKRWRCGSDG
jgi:hypothetical protein